MYDLLMIDTHNDQRMVKHKNSMEGNETGIWSPLFFVLL